MKRIALFAAIMIAAGLPNGAEAITACKLQQPDRDIRKFFPESTGYKTVASTLKKAGGEELVQEFEERLGDKLDKKYEAADIEHTTYVVLKEEKPIGYVSGVNQKGQFGAMQVFTATDLEGKILTVSYQRVVSPHAKALKGKETLLQFKDLTLGDFYLNTKKVAALRPPSDKSSIDFKATVRAVRKNLIYSDIFNLDRKHDKQFLESKKEK